MSDTKKIIELTSGSISDTSQGYIGDISTGALTRTSYRAMKDYFTAGISASLSSSLYNPGQLNLFSSSVLLFTGSIQTQVNNVYASESRYTLTSSFNTFTASYNSLSSSYHLDSASFDTRINNNTGGYNPAQLNLFTASILNYTGSETAALINVFASQSNYALTSSLNTVSASGYITSASLYTLSSSLAAITSSTPGIDTVIGVSQSFTTNRLINAHGFSFTVDSASAFNINTNGVPISSSNEGLILENKTGVSALNLYQYSPSVHWKAHVFNTTDKVIEWRSYSTSEKQGMSFKGDLVFENQLAGGGWTEKMRIAGVTGIVTSAGGFFSSGSTTGISGNTIGGQTVSCANTLILGLNEVTTNQQITTPTTVITSGSITLTMPSNNSSGVMFYVSNIGAGTVQLSSSNGNITNGLTSSATWNLTQGKYLQFTTTTALPGYYVLAYN